MVRLGGKSRPDVGGSLVPGDEVKLGGIWSNCAESRCAVARDGGIDLWRGGGDFDRAVAFTAGGGGSGSGLGTNGATLHGGTLF